MDPVDTLVRTIYGEAGNEPVDGQRAVAAVIMNRARKTGLPLSSVATSPGQFESWDVPASRARINALKTTDPKYQEILKNIMPIYNGTADDPTGGADHFYSPKAQAQLGRNPPKWDDGSGQNIGNHRFFKKGAGTADDDFMAVATSSGSAANSDGDFYKAAGTSVPTYKAGESPFDQLHASAAPVSDETQSGLSDLITNAAKVGRSATSIRSDVNNYLQTRGYDPTKSQNIDDNISSAIAQAKLDATRTPTAPGHGLAVDVSDDSAVPDQIKLPPQDVPSPFEHLTAGIPQGLFDVNASIQKQFQGVEDAHPWLKKLDTMNGFPTIDQALDKYKNDTSGFDALHGDSGWATAGRLGGNILATAPLIAAGGGVLGAGADAAGLSTETGLGGFLAGNSGRAIAATDSTAAVPTNMLVRGASVAAHGAEQGAGAGALTSATNNNGLGSNMLSGALAGGVIAPAGTAAGAIGNKLMRGGGTIDPYIASLAQKGADNGINIRGSQISNSPALRTLDSVLARIPGSGMADANVAQRAQVTRAVSNTFGEDAPRLTTDVVNNAYNRIGGAFDRVLNRTPISVDDGLVNDLANIEKDAPGRVEESALSPIRVQLGNVLNAIKGSGDGRIDGKMYQSLVGRGSGIDGLMGDDNAGVRHYAGEIKNALDDAWERSAPPEDVADFQNARYQYKNLKTVEPLIAKSSDRTITPSLLQARVKANFPDKARNGGGDLGDIADVGQQFLKDQGSSNTAERAPLINLLTGLGGSSAVFGGGGMLGHILASSGALEMLPNVLAQPTMTGAGMVGGGLVARALSTRLQSPAYANRLVSAALDNNGGAAVPSWLGRNYVPMGVIAQNRLTAGSTPVGR
jgi:hypothetical protein